MNRLFVSLAAFAAIAVSAGAQVPAPAPTPPAVSPPIDTSYVEYRESWITLPLGIGFRIPSYNRVDGAVIPWGPKISLADERIEIDPTIAYRSHIGKIDPFVLFKARTREPLGIGVELAGGRGTFTNDAWIRSDIVNSLAALFVGSDSRNYFRSDRYWGFVSKEIGFTHGTLTPAVGARFEDDWSTGVPVRHTNAPWSMFGKTDTLKMRRTNPSIDEGRINSGLGRVVGEYEREGVKGSFEGLFERSFKTPVRHIVTNGIPIANTTDADFTQVTLHAVFGFPTFRTQRFDFRGHTVLTNGYQTPRQRFAYLGGAGTLATVDLLALGGDKLFFAEGTYSVPLERVLLPVVGSPIVSLRYAAGSAGSGDLPDFIQNIGLGLGVKMLKVEYHIDPNYKKTSFTHKTAFAVSLDLAL
ncbi:MAG TPA: hypothetical protein VNC11_16535 [Gemmatimonadaceae bacterium]|jgi:hypothetical protein|nr:hypothetical protein [Gemmatimonadaceae bacterium]